MFSSGGLEKGLGWGLNPNIDFCGGSYFVDGMKSMRKFIGEPRQSAESRPWLEANEFSKNSRVAPAL
jgi:hypothetical protein